MDLPESIGDVLDKYGVYGTTTKGTSMQPLFRTRRDMIILERPTRELKKYDVVLYSAPYGKNIMHRIIKVLPDKYLIRGDNTFSNEYIPKEDIIAVMVAFNRNGRRYEVTTPKYKVYCVLWTAIYPVRKLLFKFRNLVLRTSSFVKRRVFRAHNGDNNGK